VFGTQLQVSGAVHRSHPTLPDQSLDPVSIEGLANPQHTTSRAHCILVRMPPRPSQIPATLGRGRYRLEEAVGSGGMAFVYRARDTLLDEVCAVKVLQPHVAGPKARSRFLHEARTMQSLDHENIMRIRDVGDEDDFNYFAMDLARGGSLADLVRKHGTRSPGDALQFVFDVLRGLDYAHRAGVVHRDVKPHNMVLTRPVTPTDPHPPIQITDFGIARHLQAPEGTRITGTGDTLGTLAYMSPEQRLDPRSAGPASDVYGVGATLYILVTGRRPFDLAVAHQDASIYTRIPDPVREVVRRATVPDARDRYPSARAMAEAIARAIERVQPGWSAREELDTAFEVSDSNTIVPP
jgi:serine/threonine-protein kinase